MARDPRSEQERFREYLGRLSTTIGHADRRGPLEAYLKGLLLPGDRKSVEAMAARIDPRRVQARHQSMHHFVATAAWDGEVVLRKVVDYVLAQMERHGPVAGWLVDDTGIPKRGRHSVGVGRQYCGALGKQDSCQVVVSVSLANATLSVPCFYRLYLPESWAKDEERRAVVGVPPEVRFQTKWQLALSGIDQMIADQLPYAPVVADAGYGDTTAFRDELTKRKLGYVVGIKGETTFWPPGMAPLPPQPWSGRGRRPARVRRSTEHKPVPARTLAMALPAQAWTIVKWREGTRGLMESRFVMMRVHPAHRDQLRREPRPEEWLLVEWPPDTTEPTKYWLANLAQDITMEELVRLAKLRWRIERDYEELKGELGLDHYEGRGWRGFHHHGILCIAAYAFLTAERARLSPPAPITFLQPAALPQGFRPRGATAQA
jgi:SRSO17 transposase